MHAIICREPAQLALEDRPEPKRAPDEVLIQIRRAGICGTDFHIYEGSRPYLDYPRVMGHELSTEVLEARPSSGFKPGQLLIVNPIYLAERATPAATANPIAVCGLPCSAFTATAACAKG